MTRIYLIRHAEAEGNLYRIAQGQYDSLITDRGYRQIEALAGRFDDIPIDAVYSSDLSRTCITAAAIYMVTPPNRQGKIADAVLAAARIAGVTKIIKSGGAQAVAALAYGTESVPRVDKIVGPGGIFVATAKRKVFGLVAIDMDWAVRGVSAGAGEIVLNSIDTDGVKNGFDLEMLDALACRVGVPIIASGGAGKREDFAELFTHPGIDAGLAASIFHTRQVDIKELKAYLRARGVEMRI